MTFFFNKTWESGENSSNFKHLIIHFTIVVFKNGGNIRIQNVIMESIKDIDSAFALKEKVNPHLGLLSLYVALFDNLELFRNNSLGRYNNQTCFVQNHSFGRY